MYAAVGTEEEERRGAPAVACPALQIVFGDANLVQEDTDFGHVALEGRLAHIGPQGFVQLFLPVGNPFGQAVEGTQAVGDFAGNMFVEECFLQIYQVMIVMRCHIVVVCNRVIKITIRRQIQFKIIPNSLSRENSISWVGISGCRVVVRNTAGDNKKRDLSPVWGRSLVFME